MIGLFALPSATCFAGAAWLLNSDHWQGWVFLVVGLMSLYKTEIMK